jgi:ligand-binding sensor domain-containing protein
MHTRPALAATGLLTGSLLLLPGCQPAPPAEPETAISADATVAPPGLLFEAAFPPADPAAETRISEFVRRIHQDRRGHLWFGTNGDGIARYDGATLTYFTEDDGLAGPAVRGIVEDADGTLWIGTSGGVSRYADGVFTTYREAEGLPGRDVWSMCLDRRGDLWVGTMAGACRLDAATGRFVAFPLPSAPGLDPMRGVSSLEIVHAITEDRSGNLWFAVGIGGVHRYDGTTLTQFTTADGLIGDSVNAILQDRRGDLWFATHNHGVCRFDGTSFVDVLAEAGEQHERAEVWSLYQDSAGDIWFPVENAGLYRHDGTRLHRYAAGEDRPTAAIQCVFEDRDGGLWMGGYRGLFRLDGDTFIPVGKDGPWS